MQESRSLMVRLDKDAKAIVLAAAEMRRVSVSAYVRSVMIDQATRDLSLANSQTISMTPGEQLEFWNALAQQPKLTDAQEELAVIMRGEA